MSPVKQGLKCHPAQVPTSWKTLLQVQFASSSEHSPSCINLSSVWWHKSFQVIWEEETQRHSHIIERVLPTTWCWLDAAGWAVHPRAEYLAWAFPWSSYMLWGSHAWSSFCPYTDAWPSAPFPGEGRHWDKFMWEGASKRLYSKIPHLMMHQKGFSTGSKKSRLFLTCTSRV